MSVNPDTVLYEIQVEGDAGVAVVSEKRYADEKREIVMILSLGDYTLNFNAEEKI